MLRFVMSRLLHAAATLAVAVSLVFLAVRVLPGNPLAARFGQHTDEKQIAELQEQYGWDRPLVVQLGEFLGKLVRGDLGKSLVRTHVSIREELARRIPATAELTLAALALAIPIGIGSGVAAAVFHGRWPDRLTTVGSLLGVSVPVFFLGILARLYFSQLPTSQRLPTSVFDFEPLTGLYLLDTLLRGRPELWLLAAQHLLLPALVLSTIPAALIAKITRASMLDVLSSDYIRTAQAKGAGLARIVWRHAFPNAAVPIVNITGLQVGLLLSGAVLTETVFDWPGLGQYLTTAVVRDRDYMAVQGGALVVAAIFVSLNLVLDILYGLLDPRIHHAQRGRG
jgi:peptide/nickel transport system permease protein